MPIEEPRAMREIHEIRERLAERLAGMTREERLRYYEEQARPLRRIFAERRSEARKKSEADRTVGVR